MSQSKYTQLSLKERIVIENRLKNNESLRSIAQCLGRNVSTISREIKKNGSPPKRTRVNKPCELKLDSRHYRRRQYVDTIRSKKERYQD